MLAGINTKIFQAAGVLSICLCLAANPAAAQNANDRISYSQILANPDDLGLSVKYAQQLITDGELQKATISLERVLLLNPEIDKARLLLALVFYRLGSFPEAESELKTLQSREISAEDAAVVSKYLNLIAEKRRLWEASTIFSVGVHYDTNKNSNSSSSQIQAIDLLFDNTGEDVDDFGLISVIGAEYKTKLNPVDPHEVSISSAFVFDNQEKLNNVDTVAIAPKVGFNTVWRTFELSASTGMTNVRVDDVEFLNIYDLKLRGSRLFKYEQLPLNIYTEISTAYEDFQNTARTTTGNELDGYAYGLKTGMNFELAPQILFGSDINVSRKYAKIDFNSFTQFGSGINLSAPLNNTATASLNVSFSNKFLDDPDPFISSTEERSETTANAGLNILLRMDKILSDLNWMEHESFSSGLIGSLGLNYKKNWSNIENFRYENGRLQFLLTKQVKF
ncbi:MAG: hypothetical protein VW521_12790 [Rhodospirillales bacterium]